MQEWIAVLRAADTAARWHVHQRRKGAAGEPYINHLLEVASLVAEATGGADPNLVIAALLHDAIEDQGVTRNEIAESFGEDVASLVAEVTDDKALAKAERKRRQVETASTKSLRAKQIKLADKTSNLRALATSAPAGWSVERKLEYIRWAREVAGGLRGTSPHLEGLFDAAASVAEASLDHSGPSPQGTPPREMRSAVAVLLGRMMQVATHDDPELAAQGKHLETCARAAMAAGLATVPRRMLSNPSSDEQRGEEDPVCGFTSSSKN